MTSYNDRVEGVLLATAAGDALGAPYEFKPPRGPELEVAMVGGGAVGARRVDRRHVDGDRHRGGRGDGRRPARRVRTGRHRAALVRVVAHRQRRRHPDRFGARGLRRGTASSPRRAPAPSRRSCIERTGRTAGNGSLMRTAPVALAYLDDEDAMVEAARAISELTHFDPDAGDACVLWCCAIRHAVLTGELDVRIGLRHIESGRRDLWAKRLDDAESARPASFAEQRVGGRGAAGRVVGDRHHAGTRRRSGRWSVPRRPPSAGAGRRGQGWIRHRHGRGDRGRTARRGVRRVRGPGSVGAACCTAGRASPRTTWWHSRRPSSARASRTGSTSRTRVRRSTPSRATRTTTVCCSAASASFAELPEEVDAVVSLCRVAETDMRDDMPHVEVRLIDRPERDENPHLDFVLLDTVGVIEQFRREGRTVLVHCVGAYSRTPTMGALYGARLRDVSGDEALRDVIGRASRCQPEPRVPESVAAHRVPERHGPRLGGRSGRCTFVWNGVLDPSLLSDDVVAAGHRLADAAKVGDW